MNTFSIDGLFVADKVGQGNLLSSWYETVQYIVLEFGYLHMLVWFKSVISFKGCITLK